MHQALLAYAGRVWRRNPGAPAANPARLAMTVLCKRAASGPIALLVSLKRRLDLLGREAVANPVQMSLPLDEDPDRGDELPEAVLAAQGLADNRSGASWNGYRDGARGVGRRRQGARPAAPARPCAPAGRGLHRVSRHARGARPAPGGARRRGRAARRPRRRRPAGGYRAVHLGRRPRTCWPPTPPRSGSTSPPPAAWSSTTICRGATMRLEQRIGRLDRIGQRRAPVTWWRAAPSRTRCSAASRFASRRSAGQSDLATALSGRCAIRTWRRSSSASTGCLPRRHPASLGPRAARTRPARRSPERSWGRGARRGAAAAVRALCQAHAPGGRPPDLPAVLAACARTAPWRFVFAPPGSFGARHLRALPGARGGRPWRPHPRGGRRAVPPHARAGRGRMRGLSPWPVVAPAFDAVAARGCAAIERGGRAPARHPGAAPARGAPGGGRGARARGVPARARRSRSAAHEATERARGRR